ncbi:unnamed protein product [Didymodactylos carnosus]|uniref:NAD(P)(+)--arginine ADP-ribosyltransferase n=1 Tax=Didymodactylos carnosus TaxID=1234261 RepID=A0A8S2QA56_9BILA|nr:unnamed protein product [Didymodactylos carnosus]CAF4085040.1 unnamed protein product [Didymodactylos carnosus]
MSALKKLPPIQDRVWRGVNGDISKQYLKATIHVWWGSSSCSDEVMVTDTFLDQTTPRTLFNIKCFDGKSIQYHSYFPNESEMILASGTYIKVKSQSHPAENFYIVQCDQIEPVSEEEILKSWATAGVTTAAASGTLPTMKAVLYLIWLNQNVNKSQDNLKIQEKLRTMFEDDFQTFEKLDECETSIRQKTNDSILLIVGGQIGRQVIPKIHALTQLTTVKAVVMRANELNKEVGKEKHQTVAAVEGELAQATISDEQLPLLTRHLSGYEKRPLVSLEEAIEPLNEIVPDIRRNTWITKVRTEKDGTRKDGLTRDESAAIALYTMEGKSVGCSLETILNQSLRSEERTHIKPFFSYLKLFMTALQKLPSFEGIVWRGMESDLSQEYKKGQRGVWWHVSSTTPDAEVLKNLATNRNTDMFLN